VGLTGLVVQHQPLLGGLGCHFCVDDRRALRVVRRQEGGLFERSQRPASVPVGCTDEDRPRLGPQVDGPIPQAPLLIGQSALDELQQVLVRERFEPGHEAARQ